MNLRELLIKHEGVRKRPYIDTTGHITIGIGRNLSDNDLSENEIELLFINDVNRATDAVTKRIPWSRQLDEDRFNVLIDMCFNLGIDGLLKFVNFLAALRVGAYASAAEHMLNSKWARQVGNRAVELSNIIRGQNVQVSSSGIPPPG